MFEMRVTVAPCLHAGKNTQTHTQTGISIELQAESLYQVVNRGRHSIMYGLFIGWQQDDT